VQRVIINIVLHLLSLHFSRSHSTFLCSSLMIYNLKQRSVCIFASSLIMWKWTI
jgi:hypothetical protein